MKSPMHKNLTYKTPSERAPQRRMWMTRLPTITIQRLKRFSLSNDVPMQELVDQAVNLYLDALEKRMKLKAKEAKNA